MANRNYNPVRGAGYEITNLAGGWLPLGGAGTFNNIDGATWFTVTRQSAGNYTITLQDTFPAAYGVSFSVSTVTGGTNYTARLNLPTGVSLNSLLGTTKAIPIQIVDNTNTAADPPNNAASVVYFSFVMKNSTVSG